MENKLNDIIKLTNPEEQDGFAAIEAKLELIDLQNEKEIVSFLKQMKAYDESLSRILTGDEIAKRKVIFDRLANQLQSICLVVPFVITDIRDWYRGNIADAQKVEGKLLDEKYFQQIPNRLINDVRNKKLIPLDVVVYAVFANFLGNNEGCWPSNATVAKAVGRTERCIQRCSSRLEEAGHIDRSQYSNMGTKFTRLKTRAKWNGFNQERATYSKQATHYENRHGGGSYTEESYEY